MGPGIGRMKTETQKTIHKIDRELGAKCVAGASGAGGALRRSNHRGAACVIHP